MKSISFSVIFLLFSWAVIGQGTGEIFSFSSYEEFDLEGGYYPGSFLTIKKKSPQAPLFTVERLEKVVCEKKIFQYSKPFEIPGSELDRKKTFQTSLNVAAKYQGIDPEVKGVLQNAKYISLRVSKGKRYFIESGAIAIQDIIYALPLQELTKIQFELKNKRKVVMISEVIEYEEAELVFSWDKEIGTNLKGKVPQAVQLGIENNWTDEGDLLVKFKPGHLVGYKAVEIGKEYAKLIEERIQFRKEYGDDKCLFIDEDKDGFGNANSKGICVPQSLLSKYPNYVLNNQDCYDKNPDARPGQTSFFLVNRGDGSFDYNCDGLVELEFNHNGRCQGGSALVGWDGRIPQPGETGQWLVDCDRKISGVEMERVGKKQGGR